MLVKNTNIGGKTKASISVECRGSFQETPAKTINTLLAAGKWHNLDFQTVGLLPLALYTGQIYTLVDSSENFIKRCIEFVFLSFR